MVLETFSVFYDEKIGDGTKNHLVKVTSKFATLGSMNLYKREKAGESAEGGGERG